MFIKDLTGSIIFYSLKVTIRSLEQQLRVALLCEKQECQKCHFVPTPEVISGLLGSGVRTVLEEFLPRQTYFAASGVQRGPGDPGIPDCRHTVWLNWECGLLRLLLKQLSLVQPGEWEVSPKSNNIPSTF